MNTLKRAAQGAISYFERVLYDQSAKAQLGRIKKYMSWLRSELATVRDEATKLRDSNCRLSEMAKAHNLAAENATRQLNDMQSQLSDLQSTVRQQASDRKRNISQMIDVAIPWSEPVECLVNTAYACMHIITIDESRSYFEAVDDDDVCGVGNVVQDGFDGDPLNAITFRVDHFGGSCNDFTLKIIGALVVFSSFCNFPLRFGSKAKVTPEMVAQLSPDAALRIRKFMYLLRDQALAQGGQD